MLQTFLESVPRPPPKEPKKEEPAAAAAAAGVAPAKKLPKLPFPTPTYAQDRENVQMLMSVLCLSEANAIVALASRNWDVSAAINYWSDFMHELPNEVEKVCSTRLFYCLAAHCRFL
jgi:hypothetical protein